MDDYVENLNNPLNVDNNLLTIFIHFWNLTIPALEGRKSLSVECTPETLVSMSSSPLPLSAKLCPMCVH